MTQLSLTLNYDEECMVDSLSKYYERDVSSIIRNSIRESYENMIDRELIAEFEAREKNGEVKFFSADEILSMLEKREHAV